MVSDYAYRVLQLRPVTDFDGYTRLSMSLHQLEYLQHYIHEMRLADPVWVKHITSLGDLDKAHESDKDVGLPEYPEGEEWLRLPDAFIHGKQIVNVVSQISLINLEKV